MRSTSTDGKTCQVVPAQNELPCTRKAKSKGGASTPRLCPSHWKEYGRQYKAYKVSSKQAEAIYEETCKLLSNVQWTCPLPVALGRAEKALGAAKRCIAALDQEIRERDAHHKRFFTQVDPGHDWWSTCLRNKRRRVEERAGKLRVKTIIAIEDEAARIKAQA